MRARVRCWLVVLAAVAASVVVAPVAGAAPTGQVFGAGYNDSGQLGGIKGEYVYSFAPLEGLSSVVQVSSGNEASLALLSDGTVQASGGNHYGELGDESTTGRKAFAAVPGLVNVTAVAAGGYSGYALLSNGTVEAWGYNYYGELGNGETTTTGCDCIEHPVLVKGVGGVGVLSNVVAISAGYEDAVALLSNGTVVSWGEGASGQLGNGESNSSDVPVQVKNVGGTGTLSGVSAISAGAYFSMALLSNGSVVDWGYGAYGELGNGKELASDVPVQVQGVGGSGTLSGVSAISGGTYFGMALLSDGSVVDWGYGGSGELGNGESKPSDVPVHVQNVGGTGTLSGVSEISAGAYYALAVGQDGSLYGWGESLSGELGEESSAYVLSPKLLSAAPAGIFSLGHGDYSFTSLVIQGAKASLSATSLSFPSETVGVQGAAQSVTLRNEGPAPLTVSGVVLTGSGATAFSKSADSCSGVTLAAGGSCTVSLTFKPGAAGTDNATLAFTTSAFNALPPVSLSGTGTSPITPATTTTTTTTTSTPPATTIASAPGLLRVGAGKVQGANALLALRCSGAGACKGSLELVARVVQKRIVKRHGKRHVLKHLRIIVIGKAKFSLGKGKKQTLRVHLNAKGVRLLRKAGRRGLAAHVTGSDLKASNLRLRQPPTPRKQPGKHRPRSRRSSLRR